MVVFYIGPDPGMRFGNAAEFILPVAVEDHPVDVATPGGPFPSAPSWKWCN